MSAIICPYCDSVRVKETGDMKRSDNKMGTEYKCGVCDKTFFFETPEKTFVFVNKSDQDWKILIDGEDEDNPHIAKAKDVFLHTFKKVHSENEFTVTIGNEPRELTVFAGGGGLLYKYEQLKEKQKIK